jgi:hypothetical protein
MIRVEGCAKPEDANTKLKRQTKIGSKFFFMAIPGWLRIARIDEPRLQVVARAGRTSDITNMRSAILKINSNDSFLWQPGCAGSGVVRNYQAHKHAEIQWSG